MNKKIIKQEKDLRNYILSNCDNDFINKLKEINPFKTIFTFFHIWASIVISFFVVYLVIDLYALKATIWLIPIAIFIATRQNALAVQIHEAAHYHLFKNRKINDKFCNLFASYWILNDVESYRGNHLRHHRFLHSKNDPDKELYSIQKNGDDNKINLLLFIQDILLITAFKRILVYSSKEKRKNNNLSKIIDNIFKVLAQAIVYMVLYFSFGNYLAFFIWIAFWVIPLFCILPVIIRIRIVAEHFQEESLKRTNFTCRTTKGNAIVNFLLGSCMEYHFEHHVIPYIPHYNLKLISNELETRNDETLNYNYDNFKNIGYIDYWYKLIKKTHK